MFEDSLDIFSIPFKCSTQFQQDTATNVQQGSQTFNNFHNFNKIFNLADSPFKPSQVLHPF